MGKVLLSYGAVYEESSDGSQGSRAKIRVKQKSPKENERTSLMYEVRECRNAFGNFSFGGNDGKCSS